MSSPQVSNIPFPHIQGTAVDRFSPCSPPFIMVQSPFFCNVWTLRFAEAVICFQILCLPPHGDKLSFCYASTTNWRGRFERPSNITRCARLLWVQDPRTYSRRRDDPPLLAIPASWGRVADLNPNWDRFSGISSVLRLGNPLYRPLYHACCPGHKGHADLTSSLPSSPLRKQSPAKKITQDRGCAR